MLLAAFAAACGENTVTNNYFDLPENLPDGGRDAGQTPLTSSSESTLTSSSETSQNTLFDAGETMTSAPVGQSTVPDAGMSGDTGLTEQSTDLDASAGPLAEGAPLVNTPLEELGLDVFGTFQNRYWFVATPEQVDAINAEFQGGGGGWGGGYGDIYSPNAGSAAQNTVDHLLVSTPDGKTADFGEMQVKLVGQSTGRPWTADTLPNIKIDSDDVTPELRLGGYEHLRFNNGVIGTIYREKFVYELYRALGYPAPLATYGWVSSTVWGPDIEVPYIVVESYKRGFCTNREEYFGGECPNMWEFAQDLGYGVFDVPENCQFETCDSSRANEFEGVVLAAQIGQATLEDVGEYLDWERFHEFQCLSWMFGTTDDAIHGGNNTVWAERTDGKFQLLPYSIDISFDIWGGGQQLAGYTSVPSLCQNDAGCWADTIATCERLIESFIEVDPVGRLDTLHEQIEEAGMLRAGDQQRYQDLRSTLERLITQLPNDLEIYRDDPWGGSQDCPYPFVQCGPYCELPQDCYLCQDDGEQPGDAGVVSEPLETVVTDASQVDAGVEADVALVVPRPADPVPMPTAVPFPPPPPGGGGEKPDFCYWEYGVYGVK